MIYVFDQDDNLLTSLSNDSDETCPYESPYLDDLLNETTEFEFTVPTSHFDSQYIKGENQVAVQDIDGVWRLFVIKELDENLDEITAICISGMNEITETRIEDKRPQDATAEAALSIALERTRYQPGIVAELGVKSTNFYRISAAKSVEKITNTWGGEVRDRVEFDESGITGRYIDLLTRRGADTGHRFEVGMDIESVEVTIQSYPITALYGYGKSLETDNGGYTRHINIADVEWSTANGDPVDKPIGQTWVGDPDALARWGRLKDGERIHREGEFVDSQEEDPARLLEKTWTKLQGSTEPNINTKMTVRTLEHISGYEHKKVRLGDTTHAFIEELDIVTEQRVIRHRYNIDDFSDAEVEIGDPILTDNESERLEQVESKLTEKEGLWDKSSEITDESFPDEVPPVPSNFTANGLFKIIQLMWDYNPSSYIAAYEVYASQVKDFVPDSSNLVWRGKSGGYNHEANTDEQWYYRLRAVNTHGTPSDYTEEFTATTARVQDIDIAIGAVNAEKLADLAVTAEKLADASVKETKIANLAVGNAAIQNQAVTNAKIANLAVSTAQLQDAVVTNAKIADLAVDGAKIAKATITDAHINELSANKITSGYLSTERLVVGDFTNLCPEPTFSRFGDEWTGSVVGISSGSSTDPTQQIGEQTGRNAYTKKWFPVIEGEQVLVNYQAWSNESSQTFGVGLQVKFKDGSTQHLMGTSISPSMEKNAKRTATITIPTDAVEARTWTLINASSNFGHWYFTNVEVRKMIGSALINDLTADKISTGTLKGVSLVSTNGANSVEISDGAIKSKIDGRDMINISNYEAYFYDSGSDYGLRGTMGAAWKSEDTSKRGFGIVNFGDYFSIAESETQNHHMNFYNVDLKNRSSILAGSPRKDGYWDGVLRLRSTYTANWGGVFNNNVPSIDILNYDSTNYDWGGVHVYTGRSSDSPGEDNERFGFEVWQYTGELSGTAEQLLKIDRADGSTFTGVYTDEAYLPIDTWIDTNGDYVHAVGLRVDGNVESERGALNNNGVIFIDRWEIPFTSGSNHGDYTFSSAQNIFAVFVQIEGAWSNHMLARAENVSNTGFRMYVRNITGDTGADNRTYNVNVMIVYEPAN
ncbi:phage minor structural protein, N-terminal region [Salinibacillus kushneri]|uniref:Phage minor structural protein, N-terminal region n=1 Tax=Salinibacillus kushneri TaxID=237682 RepID=A0A1I0IF25_9BACI|nr:prophage endopeptidase tail family protein [Salinibacillus kushneri]SET94610.1 phage minor structural protein, N-terminal region [Salinibacillus kushneri]